MFRDFGEDSDGIKSVESESASEEESGNDKDSSAGSFKLLYCFYESLIRQFYDSKYQKMPRKNINSRNISKI